MTFDTERLGIQFSEPTLEPWRPRGERDIAVLMSGGVDSSVTALLLKQTGWNVLGVTMKIPVAEGCGKRSCCGMEAAYVCRDLGVAHYYLEVRSAFEKLVIEPFRRSYARGETPSPCVDCNTVFKFGFVWDAIKNEFGIDHMATGHYARVLHTDSGARLARAIDKSKDQSYFLYGIPRDRLERFALPLGELTKSRVREIARSAKLPVARRPESMELCFAGEGDYRTALTDQPCKGPIVNSGGEVIGEHEGIVNYTVGQRKGLGIAAGRPLYVIRVDAEANSVMTGTWDEAQRREVRADTINVLIPDELHTGQRLYGKIRSQGEPSACTVTHAEAETLEVEFDKPQFAPAPGQRLVVYNTYEQVVAGGTIV
ncbi:MAG: tRNA 2-thiouridine(34) synthase MnmA [Armatimonadetes bacterium]|nr:tRNA 2-thiouridine(34) synthase MnmA [Armatimonadota bacterium]